MEVQQDTIQVIMLDDHQIVLEGINSLLRDTYTQKIEVLHSATQPDELLEFLRLNHKQVDIAILDIQIPDSKIDGIDLTKIIRERYPDIKVLILSSFKMEAYVVGAVQAGAAGYVVKNRSAEDLVKAIFEVQAGNNYYDKDILKILTESVQNKNKPKKTKLTKTEVKILKKIAEGKTAVQIAEEEHNAVSTIDTHRRNIMDKVGVKNIKELILYAVKNGYTD